jgi:hypothetical protein
MSTLIDNHTNNWFYGFFYFYIEKERLTVINCLKANAKRYLTLSLRVTFIDLAVLTNVKSNRKYA